MVGTLSYPPNAAGAAWLCGEVLPRLPGVRARLVGRAPPPAVRALAGPLVEVAADVPDVAPWYARSAVAVVPLHAGGGTRIKLLEALAHGVPVVATPVGAEGLSVDARRGVLIAADPADFARACATLLADPARAARLGAAGRAWVRRHHAVARVAPRVAE